jgi:hypothetical protein
MIGLLRCSEASFDDPIGVMKNIFALKLGGAAVKASLN